MAAEEGKVPEKKKKAAPKGDRRVSFSPDPAAGNPANVSSGQVEGGPSTAAVQPKGKAAQLAGTDSLAAAKLAGKSPKSPKAKLSISEVTAANLQKSPQVLPERVLLDKEDVEKLAAAAGVASVPSSIQLLIQKLLERGCKPADIKACLQELICQIIDGELVLADKVTMKVVDSVTEAADIKKKEAQDAEKVAEFVRSSATAGWKATSGSNPFQVLLGLSNGDNMINLNQLIAGNVPSTDAPAEKLKPNWAGSWKKSSFQSLVCEHVKKQCPHVTKIVAMREASLQWQLLLHELKYKKITAAELIVDFLVKSYVERITAKFATLGGRRVSGGLGELAGAGMQNKEVKEEDEIEEEQAEEEEEEEEEEVDEVEEEEEEEEEETLEEVEEEAKTRKEEKAVVPVVVADKSVEKPVSISEQKKRVPKKKRAFEEVAAGAQGAASPAVAQAEEGEKPQPKKRERKNKAKEVAESKETPAVAATASAPVEVKKEKATSEGKSSKKKQAQGGGAAPSVAGPSGVVPTQAAAASPAAEGPAVAGGGAKGKGEAAKEGKKQARKRKAPLASGIQTKEQDVKAG